MIDPSTADVTARVVECLGRYGWPATHPVIQRAVQISAEGSDRGRAVVRALGRELRVWDQRRAAGAGNGGADRARILPARGGMAPLGAKFRWRIWRIHRFLLRSRAEGQGRQHGVPDGVGADRIAGGKRTEDPAIARAVNHLVEQQQADGSWAENEFTGTGFPCVFYLKYHLYRNYFPLYALARYRNMANQNRAVLRVASAAAGIRAAEGLGE